MFAQRAAIFDLDGTLVDSRQAIVRAVIRGTAEAARQSGADYAPTVEQVVAALGLPSLEYFRRVLPSELDQLAEVALQRSTQYEVEALRAGEGMLFPGVLEGLAALRRQGWRIAIVSNAQRAYFRTALDTLALANLCDFAMCQEELPATTTSSEPTAAKQQLIAHALAALQVRAAASWVLGDRADDLRAGRALGCLTAAASYGFGAAAEHVGADLHCACFADFTRRLQSSARSEP